MLGFGVGHGFIDPAMSVFIDPKTAKGASSNLDRSSYCFLVGCCFTKHTNTHPFPYDYYSQIVNPLVVWSSHILNFNLDMGDAAQQVHTLNLLLTLSLESLSVVLGYHFVEENQGRGGGVPFQH